MNRTAQRPEHSRTADLWRRFIGCFGGDAVHRKYGEEIPPEWIGMVAQLTDAQLEKGLRRMVHSGTNHVPTLPEFVKWCRTIGGDYEDGIARSQITYTRDDDYSAARQFANLVLVDWLTWRLRGKREIYLDETTARAMYAKAREIADVFDMLEKDADPEADTERFLDSLCNEAIALLDADEAREYRVYARKKQVKR